MINSDKDPFEVILEPSEIQDDADVQYSDEEEIPV